MASTHTRLSIQYRVTCYDAQTGKLLPHTALNDHEAAYYGLKHTNVIFWLLSLIDESKLDNINSTDLHVMLESIGELGKHICEELFEPNDKVKDAWQKADAERNELQKVLNVIREAIDSLINPAKKGGQQ